MGNQVGNMEVPTYHSINWQWAVFAIMGASALGILGHSYTKHENHRTFHYLNATVCGIAALSYLCMSIGVGNVLVGRQVFYPQRYLDWLFTTPLLLIELSLYVRRPIPTIFMIVALDMLMIVAGLMAELTTRATAWGLFAFSMVCFLLLFPLLLTGMRHHPTTGQQAGYNTGGVASQAKGNPATKSYMGLTAYLLAVWSLYPLCWILYNSRVLTVDSHSIWFGVLDVLAKPVFAFLALASNPSEHLHKDDDRRRYASDVEMAGAAPGHHQAAGGMRPAGNEYKIDTGV